MLIETLSEPWRLAQATNSTASSYSARAFQTTPPNLTSNPGLIPIAKDGVAAQNLVRIVPFGVGSDDNTFLMRVYHWHHDVVPNGLGMKSWYPIPIGDFTCTLSTFTGTAGTLVSASNRVADTITLTAGYATANVSVEICSNAANDPAHIELVIKGAKYIELIFNMNSSATSANALVAML